jgi:hypothetical protein
VVDTAVVDLPLSDTDIAALRAAGTSIDTFMVNPTDVVLRIGETFDPRRDLRISAVDTLGKAMAWFPRAYIFRRRRATQQDGFQIVAMREGTDTLYVEALPRDPASPRPARASTMVLLRVVP